MVLHLQIKQVRWDETRQDKTRHKTGTSLTGSMTGTSLVQTVKSPKGLSGKICATEDPWVISLITQGTFHRQIPEDFSLFVRLWASKTKEDACQSCPMGLSGETAGSNLLKSDSVKSRLRWLKNKVWQDITNLPVKTQTKTCQRWKEPYWHKTRQWLHWLDNI